MRNLIRRAGVLAGAVAVLLGSGMGVAAAQPLPHLTITPAEHHYMVPVGQIATHTFTLRNTGGSATGNLAITVSGLQEFTITATTCRGALPPGQSCTVTVRFAPTTAGTVRATLTAAGTRPEARATAHLTGTGTAPVTVAHLYWANYGSGTIMEANRNGGDVDTLVKGQLRPTGVAVGPKG